MPSMFTDEDNLYPVYCTKCKAHTPRAVSNANNGLCANCVAPAPQVLSNPTPTKYKPTDPRPVAGKCPVCHMGNVLEIPHTVPNMLHQAIEILGLISIVCGIGLGFTVIGICPGAVLAGLGFLLFFAAMLIPPNYVASRSRRCESCGHQWAA